MFSARSLESNLGDTMRGWGIIGKDKCNVRENVTLIRGKDFGWDAIREIR
jgi:hypothetical protein